MEKETRNILQRATQEARRLLEDEYREQLEGTFDILLDGTMGQEAGPHLDAVQRLTRQKLVAAVEHNRASGITAAEAVAKYLRVAAFTTLNRFAALKMLEARGLVQECISKGEQSAGFKEFGGLAPGLTSLPDKGYRLYIENIFDEIGREVRVLFNRLDAVSLLWPRRQAFHALLDVLNQSDLASVWAEDETIGWVYQYFNGEDERRQMRSASSAPRNSRELAVRNQFFTPRYVVEFLNDNTLGRTWYEMRQGDTILKECCDYLVHRPNEEFLGAEEEPPSEADEESTDTPFYIRHRPKKDPRELRILDPACGSGHFLLYAFDLLLRIYEEAWLDPELGPPLWQTLGFAPEVDERVTDGVVDPASVRLREDARPVAEGGAETLSDCKLQEAAQDENLLLLRKALPKLILEHNLHGIDIDHRAAQIAGLALWMRAQRAYNHAGISRDQRPPVTRTHIVCAEPMPGEKEFREEFAASLDPLLRELFLRVIDRTALAGEAGSLLRIEEDIEEEIKSVFGEHGDLFKEDDESQWRNAGARLEEALKAYAEKAVGAGAYRKRLFAQDAGRGFGFIDICRRKYDVVLMNPPFGEWAAGARAWAAKAYPRTKNDIYAAFVERGLNLLHPHGLLGAITSRTGFFLTSYQKWRNEILLKEAHPTVVADLGYGVMDAAMVEAAAYCLEAVRE